MRMSSSFVIGCGLAAGAIYAATPARACSLVGPTTHVLDPAMQASDQVAPVLPDAITYEVGRGTQREGCGGASSCDGIGTVTIAAGATDDATPPGKIGYRLVREAGTLPTGLGLPAEAIETAFGAPAGTLLLNWDSGASGGDEAIDFTLRIVAVDLAGNQSPPRSVRIVDAGPDTGCAVARRTRARAATAGLVALAALVVAARGRRRRG
jgi:hypothetical protein